MRTSNAAQPGRQSGEIGLHCLGNVSLESLPGLSSNMLKRIWEEIFETPPPPRLGRRIMIYAIAYHLQESTQGKLSKTRQKALTRHANNTGRPTRSSSRIKPGTRLFRDWRGRTHVVTVLEAGVEYRGRTWTSLSAVAREITGTRWSGPLFFGLKKRHVQGR